MEAIQYILVSEQMVHCLKWKQCWLQGVEATLFATLMSVLNGGAFAGSTFGALLTRSFGVTSEDFTNLAPLVTVCTLSSLLPLPLLRLLPQGSTTDQMKSNSEKQSESA